MVETQLSTLARAALDHFAGGMPLAESLVMAGICRRDFSAALRADPDLQSEYLLVQECNAEHILEEIISIADDQRIKTQRARLMVTARLKVIEKTNRERFGAHSSISLDAGPNLLQAIQNARQRSALVLDNDLQLERKENVPLAAAPQKAKSEAPPENTADVWPAGADIADLWSAPALVLPVAGGRVPPANAAMGAAPAPIPPRSRGPSS